MNISIRISWPILGINSTVNKLLAVGSLSSGEMREYSLEIQPLVAGFTFFSINFPEKRVISSNKGTSISYHDHLLIIEKKIYLFLKDEKTQITPGLVFGHIHAKSNEELLAKQEVDYAQKALRWAIIAFGASVVFGLIDIILTILFNMNIIPS